MPRLCRHLIYWQVKYFHGRAVTPTGLPIQPEVLYNHVEQFSSNFTAHMCNLLKRTTQIPEFCLNQSNTECIHSHTIYIHSFVMQLKTHLRKQILKRKNKTNKKPQKPTKIEKNIHTNKKTQQTKTQQNNKKTQNNKKPNQNNPLFYSPVGF